MKIPRSFKIMGHTIVVEYDKLLINKDDSRGVADFRINKIILQPNVEGNALPRTAIEQTFLHELIHWICYKIGRNDLKDDETFVDSFSGLLHQALITMEYDNDKK